MRDDDPFDDFFEEIERMMNEMMSGNGEFRIESSAGPPGDGSHDVHVDVHETNDEIRVVADIPGIDKDDIDLQCDGKVLTLQARGNSRTYDERITLPVRVDEHSAGATYNNGVLEVVFDRLDDTTDIDI